MQNPAILLANCVDLNKLFNLSESKFFHLKSVDNNFYSKGLLGRFDDVILSLESAFQIRALSFF